MKTVDFSNIDNIKSELDNGSLVMYGAGGNGERILKIFQEHSVQIDYFCDDDYNKWNTCFCGIPVISYERLQEISEDENVNVILTSVFGGPILGKLEHINTTIFEAFSLLIDRYYQEAFYRVHLPKEKIEDFQRKVNVIMNRMDDVESKRILGKISEVVNAPEDMEYSHFFDVASKEDCYFIQEVLKGLPEHPVIVDCGGFTGDLMVALARHEIDYEKVYSFEVNQELFKIMQENIKRNSLEEKFIPINKGVWNFSGKAYLNVDPADIAGGMIGDTVEGTSIDTVKIDEFFENIKIDFIKMDIEGAELNALRGGIVSIKKYRPIMAVSLYHSVDDVINIPLYLFEQLENYSYIIRHHSFIDSETVLYCMPCERYK